MYVTNGFGKAIGFTQVEELGTIETPIGLTNTLNIFMVANSIVDYMIETNPKLQKLELPRIEIRIYLNLVLLSLDQDNQLL